MSVSTGKDAESAQVPDDLANSYQRVHLFPILLIFLKTPRRLPNPAKVPVVIHRFAHLMSELKEPEEKEFFRSSWSEKLDEASNSNDEGVCGEGAARHPT